MAEFFPIKTLCPIFFTKQTGSNRYPTSMTSSFSADPYNVIDAVSCAERVTQCVGVYVCVSVTVCLCTGVGSGGNRATLLSVPEITARNNSGTNSAKSHHWFMRQVPSS